MCWFDHNVGNFVTATLTLDLISFRSQKSPSADLCYSKIEDPGTGKWFLKETDEDGVFVKYEGSRLITRAKVVTGPVIRIEVPLKSKVLKERHTDSVLVSTDC